MNDAIDIIKLSLLLIAPLIVLTILWAIIAWLIKNKGVSETKPEATIRLPPSDIARRVLYKEELLHLKTVIGTIVYVIEDEHMYFFDGHDWLKIEQTYHPKID